MCRLVRKKIINFMLNKKKHKFCSEKLLKYNLKHLNKKTKKQFKFIICLALNNCLPSFQLTKKQVKIKKIKLIKYKPFFILKNKNRIFFSIKSIINFCKKLKSKISNELILLSQNNSHLINININSQEEVITVYKNVLTFYRWS